MAKQLQTRIRPYIGQPNPAAWEIVDSAERVKNDWRRLMQSAEPHQGEPEYRIVEVSHATLHKGRRAS